MNFSDVQHRILENLVQIRGQVREGDTAAAGDRLRLFRKRLDNPTLNALLKEAGYLEDIEKGLFQALLHQDVESIDRLIAACLGL